MIRVGQERAGIGRWPGYLVVDSGCWEWCHLDSLGYGSTITWRGRKERPHVIYYRMAGGTIPEGFTIDHLCRNRACVNPAHLDCVTRGENCRRGARAKITQAIADEIRRRAARGIPARSLADTFGISEANVKHIIVRRRKRTCRKGAWT